MRPRPWNDPGSTRAAAPWPAAESFSGERGRSDRRPHFARELDGEREGRERKLTTALNQSETGSGRKLHAAGEELRRRFSARSRLGAEPREERGKMGRGRLGRADSLHLKPRRGGAENVGAGRAASAVSKRERDSGRSGWR